MRSVTVFLKGCIAQSDIDREALTSWMVNNDFSSVLDCKSSIGNVGDSTVKWATTQNDVAIITASRNADGLLARVPELATMRRVEYSDEKCRQLYNVCYVR